MDGAAITLENDHTTWVLWLPTQDEPAIHYAAATSTNKSHLEELLDALEQQ